MTGAAVIASPAASPVDLSADSSKNSVVLVFGDSISAAYGMRASEGWVALLQEKLQREEYGWRVVNASVSGETTDGGRARLPRALELHRPRVVVLELGANDGLRGLPTAGMKANLEAMIVAIQAGGAKVVLIGMPLPTNYGPMYSRRFAAVFEDLASRHGLAYVPFALKDAALEADMMQADGLHPSAKAQPRLLERVWAKLRDIMLAKRN